MLHNRNVEYNMRTIFIASVGALLVALPVAAATADFMPVVQTWVDGFNRADAKGTAATCADQAAVIDDFPPHEWHGAGACQRWFTDFVSMSKAAGITAARIELQAVSHTESAEDAAYVVVPAKLSFDRRGARVTEQGILTVTLRNGMRGWAITGWVWSDQ
jgi:ketosteroid isomerase-like protein